jgi:hypothetical protein
MLVHATGCIQPCWCTYKHATGCIQPAGVHTSKPLAVSSHADAPTSTPLVVSSLLVHLQAHYWLYPACWCPYKYATSCIQPVVVSRSAPMDASSHADAPTSTHLCVSSLLVHLARHFPYPACWCTYWCVKVRHWQCPAFFFDGAPTVYKHGVGCIQPTGAHKYATDNIQPAVTYKSTSLDVSSLLVRIQTRHCWCSNLVQKQSRHWLFFTAC